MVQHLLTRLGQAELSGQGPPGQRFAVCVASDHSTPVLRGDHSCEPVPFALAHLRWVHLMLPARTEAA